jgi:Na+-transporting methylmalonyl-CoA/oxaloacetate decarboxylase gamma subunit
MSTLKLVGVAVLVVILFQLIFIFYSSSNLPSESEKPPKNKTPKVKKIFRKIQNIFKSVDSYEGGGFLVHRSIGSTNLRNLDPFLMLE